MEKKHKFILFTLLLGAFMTSLDATIVAVALPDIAKTMGEAGHNTSNISWVLLSYTLMLCCFILLWSKIGSNRGYKKVFVLGISIFSLSSLAIGLCGLSPSIGLGPIIILRAVQGIGAGMSMSMSLAMVSSYLPAEARGSSIAAVTLAASVGTAFGPAIGGVLTAFHWSYIFFINVPIGIICIIFCLKFMKVEEKLPEVKPRIDWIGAVLMFVAMFSLIFYLNRGSDIGWTSKQGIALIICAFVGAGLFVWWEGKAKDPLISLKLVKNANITRANLAGTFMFMAMAGSYLLLPYYFGAGTSSTGSFAIKGALSYSTIEYGLILVANSIGMMVVGPFVGKYSDRTGDSRTFIIVGALVAALGFFMMMFGFDSDTQLWYILLTLFIMGAGMGMAIVSSTNLAFSYIDEGENGQLSGLINTFRQAGSSAGVAILEAIFTSGIVITSLYADLRPGLEHAFFIAAILALFGFTLGMGCKNKKDLKE